MLRVESENFLLKELGLPSFSQRFPWIGGDLQTLRDTFVDEKLFIPTAEAISIEVPSKQNGNSQVQDRNTRGPSANS